MPEKLLTVRELAAVLGVAECTIYRLAHSKNGPKAVRVGKALRFRPADVTAYLEAQEIEAPEKRVAMPGMGHFHYEVGMRVV